MVDVGVLCSNQLSHSTQKPGPPQEAKVLAINFNVASRGGKRTTGKDRKDCQGDLGDNEGMKGGWKGRDNRREFHRKNARGGCKEVSKFGYSSFGWHPKCDQEGGNTGRFRNRRNEQSTEKEAVVGSGQCSGEHKFFGGYGAQADTAWVTEAPEPKSAKPEEEPDFFITYDEFMVRKATASVESDKKQVRKVANDKNLFQGKELAKEEFTSQIIRSGRVKPLKKRSTAPKVKKVLSLAELSVVDGSYNRGGTRPSRDTSENGNYRVNLSLNEQNFPLLRGHPSSN